MKKILLMLILPFLLISCTSNSPDNYFTISDDLVDGYYIYQNKHNEFFCRTLYEDVYYSDETYNYGFTFYGCSPDASFFIIHNGEYVYLEAALAEGLISMESLLPLLEQLERESEDLDTEEADYHWLGFFIYGHVVYAYAGGECDQSGTETFIINGTTYTYTANGCLKEHILYMEKYGEYTSCAELIAEGEIDPIYLIPLLTEQ